MNEIYLGLIRHALTIVGGILVTKGHLTGAQSDELAGAIVSIVGVVWSVIEKRSRAPKPENPVH